MKRSGIVVPHALGWPGRLGAGLVYALIRGVGSTIRFHFRDESGLIDTPAAHGPAIFCVWHDRLALSLLIYRFVQRHQKNRRLAAIVSASKDGGFLAAILECSGAHPVRGSSSRRGSQAVLELTTLAERGFDLAITPDGPRGPRYVVQDGVIAVAQFTGLPIIPVTALLKPKFRLNSWDRFQIPVPFGRCDVVFGRSVLVPRDLTETDRADLRRRLQRQMCQETGD